MTVTANDVKWGSYGNYEGPFFPGRLVYLTQYVETFMDKVLGVVSATEGSCYDAINMYDRCILSVGMIQYCEAGQFFVTSLLGKCAEADPAAMKLKLGTFPGGVEFKKNAAGIWRFYKNTMEVNTSDLQRLLYLGDSQVGTKGTWTQAAKDYAKAVAAWFANFWDYAPFRDIQKADVIRRMPGFLTTDANKILNQLSSNEVWEEALVAAYYSFAANLPTVASKSLISASQRPEWIGSDEEGRFYIALESLTFGPGIGIYPGRYEKIAPVLNHLFGVTAPLNANGLKMHEVKVPAVAITDAERDTASRQMQLIDEVAMGQEGIDAIDAVVKNA